MPNSSILPVCLLMASLLAAPVQAIECPTPQNQNWNWSISCEISEIMHAPRNVIVNNGAEVTIENGGALIFDPTQFTVAVSANSRLLVEPLAQLGSNEIGPWFERNTRGGFYGYHLKAVDGPVWESFNSDRPFHPSSTIKTLYMVEALRRIDTGQLAFLTNVLHCPTSVVPGNSLSCPTPISVLSSGSGSEPGAVCAQPHVPISGQACGGNAQVTALGSAICGMMKLSNNPLSNGIQDIIGSGSQQPAAIGWQRMLDGAGAAVGLSATSLANRMGCGGPENPAFNLTTLRDLERLFEGMASNPEVLFPSSRPATINFTTTDAYRFMDNDLNSAGIIAANIANRISQEGNALGLSAGQITAFANAVRFAVKEGSNTADGSLITQDMVYRTAAGWLSLPTSGGSASREYVWGLFVNEATATTTNTLRPAIPLLLAAAIRDAMQRF